MTRCYKYESLQWSLHFHFFQRNWQFFIYLVLFGVCDDLPECDWFPSIYRLIQEYGMGPLKRFIVCHIGARVKSRPWPWSVPYTFGLDYTIEKDQERILIWQLSNIFIRYAKLLCRNYSVINVTYWLQRLLPDILRETPPRDWLFCIADPVLKHVIWKV